MKQSDKDNKSGVKKVAVQFCTNGGSSEGTVPICVNAPKLIDSVQRWFCHDRKFRVKSSRISASFCSLLLGIMTCLGLLSSTMAQTVVFDFDTATPALTTGRNTPFDQTADGVTASFTSPQGGAFSVQNAGSTGYTLSQFFGNFLYPNHATAETLTIEFGQTVTNISLAFGTTDHPPIEIPNSVQLTAYSGSTQVGTPVNAAAVYGLDTFPMGTLSFNAGGAPFNIVKIALVLPGNTPTGILLDNIVVDLSGVLSYSITATAAPTAGGTVTGAGSYSSGANVNLSATANAGYTFVNWTEAGAAVSSSASYTFAATANRTLVANFVQNWTIGASANPTAGGSITGAGSYTNGANVTLSATANSGYTFVNWTEAGATVSSSASYTFTASANRTLVANFILSVQSWDITASVKSSGGGTISGSGTYTNGAMVTLVATPAAECEFVHWTEAGVVVSTSASYNFTANANRTLVAAFSPRLQVTLTTTNTARVTWSADVSGFIMQETSTLNGTDWADTTNPVEVVQGRNQVILTPTAGAHVFRLFHP